MATYRESARPERRVVETYDVLTSRGSFLTGLLAAVVVILLVVLGVSVFAGAPPAIEPYVWTFGAGAAALSVPTVWLWLRRRRRLLVVRDGDALKLVVEGEVDVTFPLTASGHQLTEHMRGVPIHHVYLKLVGTEGRGVVIQEVRGAVHGPQRAWFEVVDGVAPAVAYEATRIGQAMEIRLRVEELNRRPDDA